jgi:hypothetical protein
LREFINIDYLGVHSEELLLEFHSPKAHNVAFVLHKIARDFLSEALVFAGEVEPGSYWND